jgi:hypothetical protein
MSILLKLNKLKSHHANSKVDRTLFQPNEQEQRGLIVKNSSMKLVNQILKKEKAKYIFNQKRKIEDDMKRKDIDGFESQSDRRPFSTPASMGDRGTANIFLVSNKSRRPATTNPTEGKASGFARILKQSHSSDEVINHLIDQAQQQSKNAKRIFELLCSNHEIGVICQFSPKSIMEEIDVSYLVSNSFTVTSSTKMDPLSQFRKNGMLIIIDPSINTELKAITLHIRWMKTVDIAVEEAVEKDVTFWSNGNYFGLKLIKDSYKHQTEAFSNKLSARTKSSLPGWSTSLPIFLPNTNKCRLSWADPTQFQDSASISNQVSRLRLFCITCPTAKAGIKRLHEYLDQQVLRETANQPVPGGISALHYAALHGNISAVHQLIISGASINHRCKEDKNMTALHEAVTAGHVDIVKLLLQQRASQLLKDDSGMIPLHLACQLGHIAIARTLMQHTEGKRALQTLDNNENKPIDLCANNFLISCLEAVMRKYHIFVKPRVSLYERS